MKERQEIIKEIGEKDFDINYTFEQAKELFNFLFTPSTMDKINKEIQNVLNIEFFLEVLNLQMKDIKDIKEISENKMVFTLRNDYFKNQHLNYLNLIFKVENMGEIFIQKIFSNDKYNFNEYLEKCIGKENEYQGGFYFLEDISDIIEFEKFFERTESISLQTELMKKEKEERKKFLQEQILQLNKEMEELK